MKLFFVKEIKKALSVSAISYIHGNYAKLYLEKINLNKGLSFVYTNIKEELLGSR